MRRRILVWLLAFICAAPFVNQADCFAEFSFVVMGDSRSDHGREDGVNEDVLVKLVDLIKSDRPEFIVFAGDLVCDSNADDIEELRGYFSRWKDIMAAAGAPIYISVGNEDIDKYGSQAEGLIRETFNMPENGPQSLLELAYSFDHQNAHFVVLDTAVGGQQGLVGDEQLEWLKFDLDANNSSIVFVFGHHPLFSLLHKGNSLDRYPEARGNLLALFKDKGVDVYFCGHEHYFRRDLEDGIFQVVSGGAGAPLHAPVEGPEPFHHYCLVTVKDDGSCYIRAKDIEGNIRDESRISLH
ncbi:MAG: metallophosphoesterase [Candidatus Omnitrophica bacterium]|nr:metallophosphoesterase [Candidatus Omnitrophota bacterium]